MVLFSASKNHAEKMSIIWSGRDGHLFFLPVIYYLLEKFLEQNKIISRHKKNLINIKKKHKVLSKKHNKKTYKIKR